MAGQPIGTRAPAPDRRHRLCIYCGKARRLGWQHCETRSVSASALEQAVVGQLAAMEAGDTGSSNEVRVALGREGILWQQRTEERRQTFIRTLVRQVRYDGRTGNVTVLLANEVFEETGTGEETEFKSGAGGGAE